MTIIMQGSIVFTRQVAMISAMLPGLLHSLTALLCLLPAALLVVRPVPARDHAFWAAGGLAFIGPALLALALVWGHWVTGFAPTLWVTLTAIIFTFGAASVLLAHMWRLLPLLMPYVVLMAVMATVWQQAQGHALPGTLPSGWLGLHILVGVGTYALLTLAAVAALASFLQERALKQKRRTRLTTQLPAMADAERLSTRLLMAGEAVLAIGLGSGMAVEWFERGRLLTLDHKTLLSLLAFFLIGLLLAAHRFVGMRGRIAARLILVAWLLLTLAYPGVKFVTDVLIS